MRTTTGTVVCAVLAGAVLAGCSPSSGAATEIDRSTGWVEDYPALGEPVSAAIAVRDQGQERLPAPDDAYDAVVEVAPETMATLVDAYPDLAPEELNSFTPAWLLEELPEDGVWLRSAALDAHLEEQDGRGVIVNAYLDPSRIVSSSS